MSKPSQRSYPKGIFCEHYLLIPLHLPDVPSAMQIIAMNTLGVSRLQKPRPSANLFHPHYLFIFFSLVTYSVTYKVSRTPEQTCTTPLVAAIPSSSPQLHISSDASILHPAKRSPYCWQLLTHQDASQGNLRIQKQGPKVQQMKIKASLPHTCIHSSVGKAMKFCKHVFPCSPWDKKCTSNSSSSF